MATSLLDPYASIRSLGANTFAPTSAQTYEDDSGTHEIRGAGYQFWDPNATGVFNPSAYSPNLSWMDAGGFGSKYNDVRDNGDGTVTVRMQQPGGHKYDTMDVIYGRGADGSWTMQGDPTNTREVSSAQSQFHDSIDAMAPIIAAVAGGAIGAGGFGGAAAGGEAGWAAGGAWGTGADVGAGAAGVAGGASGSAGASGIEPISTAQTTIPEVAAGPGAGGGGITAGDVATGATTANTVGENYGDNSSSNPQGPGTTGGAGGGFGDLQQWMRDNPNAGRAIAGLLGGALTQTGGGSGGGGGGYQDSGYRPTITRGGWSPSVQARTSQAPMLGMGPGLLGSMGGQNDGLWRYRGLLGGGG